MPKELQEGVLYVSEEFGVAAHLCPCGCGNKVVTPLGPTDWFFSENKGMPTLDPSIGNWQIPCRSHYWIIDGFIHWSTQWTEEEIIDGREAEKRRNIEYYKKLDLKRRKQSVISRIYNWFFGKK